MRIDDLSSETVTQEYPRIAINDGDERLYFIVGLFGFRQGETMAGDWMRTYVTNYDGGLWDFWEIKPGYSGKTGPHITLTTSTTGYISPPDDRTYSVCIPGNHFEAEMSADAVGIIVTLYVLNQLSWRTFDMGERYHKLCRYLVEKRGSLKDYIDIVQHPERELIYRAID
ncbi:antirestriction protein [Enterobacteriaceae bacterium H11S18]|uniref:antirestriction protein n=1 Tax=Dryocola clanedunensis TaxID=2925396 RepID=UPI0022F0F2A1|nr:antirestriction protein [Dryocola clanedunensis]MCT4709170.1 antirestriction protein [Dryocola clanedunensis]